VLCTRRQALDLADARAELLGSHPPCRAALSVGTSAISFLTIVSEGDQDVTALRPLSR
jgi:hypothetical protein